MRVRSTPKLFWSHNRPHQITGVKYLLAREPNPDPESKIYGSVRFRYGSLKPHKQLPSWQVPPNAHSSSALQHSVECASSTQKVRTHINVFRFWKTPLTNIQENKWLYVKMNLFRRPELQDFKYYTDCLWWSTHLQESKK